MILGYLVIWCHCSVCWCYYHVNLPPNYCKTHLQSVYSYLNPRVVFFLIATPHIVIMAGVMNFLSAPFFHKPAKPEPLATQWVVNVVYKLNTMTGSFLFLSSCILFFREIVSDHIHCFSDANRGGGIVRKRTTIFLEFRHFIISQKLTEKVFSKMDGYFCILSFRPKGSVELWLTKKV